MKNKVMGVIRIILGIGMLVFGIMKLFKLGDATTVQMVGGAGHAMGLDFLSVTARYWIATIGEIVAGILLLCGYRYRIGAILTIIIMLFAIKTVGFEPKAIAFAIAAILVLILGAGYWTRGGKHKKGHATPTGEGIKDKVENIVDDIKETVEDVADKAEDVVEEAKEVIEEVTEKVEDTVENVQEKAEDVVEEAKEVVENVTEKVEDTVDNIQETVNPEAEVKSTEEVKPE